MNKRVLVFTAISIGVISILLAFGKYKNQKDFVAEGTSANNIIKISPKVFLENNISGKNFTIAEFENEISQNRNDHSLLLNKAIRFKSVFEGQNYSFGLQQKKCQSLGKQIGIENLKMKNTFSEGLEYSEYLFKVAMSNDPSLKSQYEKIANTQKANITGLIGFSDTECRQTLSTLMARNQGFFKDEKTGNNLISFNYVVEPEKEMHNNHYQEFSSYNNAPNEDFFMTLKLPQSWRQDDKNDYRNASTVAMFQPFEKFLNGIITISFYKKFMPEEVEKLNITDNEIAEEFYADKELLEIIFYSLNKELEKNTNIETTLFQVGNKKHILYITESNIPNGIADNIKAKTLHSINFHNGKLIKMSFTGTVSKNEFSSFPYYSKLFWKVLSSARFKELNEQSIYLTEEMNMKFLTASINNKNYKFLLDTGASNVVINKAILSELIESGYLTRDDYLGKSTAEIADGSIIECDDWKIPKLKIGTNLVENIIVSVVNSDENMLLFGMDGLNKLNVKRVDLQNNEIILNE